MMQKLRLPRCLTLLTLCTLFVLTLAACSTIPLGSSGGSPTVTASATAPATTDSSTPTHVPTGPFKVTAVDMSVNPSSITGLACGTALTVTYTAVFHVAAHGPGGTAQFMYTTDNGRGTPTASLTFAAGQTSKTYTFTWSGTLNPDNVAPGLGGVIVTSPNPLSSSLVQPTGTCKQAPTPTPHPTAAFKVTSVTITTSANVTGVPACGTTVTETYVATFHILANGPGGTIVFNYTTNNGRSNSQNIDLTVHAFQTSATYTFTWKAVVQMGGPLPGVGIILVSSPNNVESNDANPVVTTCN
jgi:hypothetical protein